ncbi:hypothetical protein ACP70R_011628 [Stipagrostis hirtigluma subsp. patula]
MAQTSAARQRVASEPEDRLSSLPDALLHTIMSFLKARQAVQTCVLSRRWVDLWRTMPCLDIDQRELSGNAADSIYSKMEDDPKFMAFVDNLLKFYEAQSVDTFRFHASDHSGLRRTIDNPWIRRGIECRPAVLEICYPSTSYELPHLGSSSCRLKRMHLTTIYLDKNFTMQLRSGCPVLEDLELDRCRIAYPKIMSCTLKNLVINDCKTHFGHVLTVATGALVSFQLAITAYVWHGIVVSEMPFLVKASICLRYHPCGCTWREGSCKLLHSLINVRNLNLSGSKTLSILHEGSDTFPRFPNLRTLLFEGCDLSHNFQIVGPSLERLTLQYCKLGEDSMKRQRREYRKTTSLECQNILTLECPDLKWTEIKYKEGDLQQLFDLLSGSWRNLQESRIVLTKA